MSDETREQTKATSFYRDKAAKILANTFRGTGISAPILIRNIEALALYLETGKLPSMLPKVEQSSS